MTKGAALVANPLESLEAATGFEPVNNGFADRCLSHLAMPPKNTEYWKNGKKSAPGVLPVREYPQSFQASIIPNFLLERETGLEPATTTLATWGSTN